MADEQLFWSLSGGGPLQATLAVRTGPPVTVNTVSALNTDIQALDTAVLALLQVGVVRLFRTMCFSADLPVQVEVNHQWEV